MTDLVRKGIGLGADLPDNAPENIAAHFEFFRDDCRRHAREKDAAVTYDESNIVIDEGQLARIVLRYFHNEKVLSWEIYFQGELIRVRSEYWDAKEAK